jgi:tetratricopeptide (TPR) repeat protein
VDLKFDDIFEVQDQVAQGIAEAMTARIARPESAAKARYTPSPEAYEKLMRGREAFSEADPAGFRRAVALFEEVVKLDPDYPDAWGDLGSTYHAMTDSGYDYDPSWYAKADEALARARALDPDNPQTRFATAAFRLTRGSKREAYEGLIDAMTIAPNMWLIYHYFSYLFRLCDMYDESEAASRRSREIDPTSPWPYWTGIRLRAFRGDLRGARELLEVVRVRFGSRANLRYSEATVLDFEERYEEVVRIFEVAGPGIVSSANFDLAHALVRLGRHERAAEAVSVVERFAAVDMDSAAHAASLQGFLGNSDAAFRHLERAASLGNDMIRFYQNPVFFGPLFTDPRWEPFLDGVRSRVAQWKREFRWPPQPVAASARSR